MIIVIADDFTGAAELAGIALRYDLKVELATAVIAGANADLLVVCTDSRSMGKQEAIETTRRTIIDALKLKPDWIYKKIDSVFRGHVLDELRVQMQESGKKKALVLGANPSLGRAITDGHYYIDGIPIDETDFGSDPEFAIRDSSLTGMLGAEGRLVKVLRHTDPLPAEGIVFGEATSNADVTGWADVVDEEWMLAGAGDFFTALLDKKYASRTQPGLNLQVPYMYVSGTAFAKSRELIKQMHRDLDCVAYLPKKMMLTGNITDEKWHARVFEMLNVKKKAVVAIDDDDVDPWIVTAVHLRLIMAAIVRQILAGETVKELFIEGGSTAAAILSELEITKLSVVNELKRGIVRMKANDLFITVKPGSYELPEQLKELYSK